MEFQSAIEYYQTESRELGIRFYREVLTAWNRVEAHPRAWPKVRGEIRKCLVRGFPYKVLYTIEQDWIHVLAVMHSSRKPGYWTGRAD